MDTDFLVTTGGTAVISALILQWIKGTDLIPWINKKSEKLNLILSILVAGFTSIGISYKFDDDTGTLVITGLTLVGISHGFYHWFTQWAAQHVAYKTAIVPAEILGDIRKLLSNQIESGDKEASK